MKLIKNIYVTVLILLCICSCTEKEFVDDTPVSSAGVAVSLKVSGADRNISRATGETAVSKESTIGNVYLLFYEDDDDLFAEPKAFIRYDNLEGVEGTWTDHIELKGLLQGQIYNVYAFANLPESTSENLPELPIRGAILELSETLDSPRNEHGSDISFSTVTTYTGGEKKISLEVIRTVARIESKIDMSGLDEPTNWEIESVNILNERNMVSYQEGLEPTGVSRISLYNAFLVGSDSLYYYAYENPSSENENDMLKLKINLHKKDDNSIKRTYTALVAKKYQGELIRNTIYRSKIILKENIAPVVIELSAPGEWIDSNVDVIIPKVYMDFPTDRILLNERGAGIYNFKSNADSIYIKWENMPNLSISPIEVVKEGYVYPKDSSTDIYELDMLMSDFDENDENGTITFTAGNLKKVLNINRPGAEGKVSFSAYPFGDTIRTYDYPTEADEIITMKFNGLSGMNAWYRVKRLKFVSLEDGSEFPYNAYDNLSGDLGSETVDFTIGDRDLTHSWGGTTYYRLELGTGNVLYSPAMKSFYFNIKQKNY